MAASGTRTQWVLERFRLRWRCPYPTMVHLQQNLPDLPCVFAFVQYLWWKPRTNNVEATFHG